MKENQLDAIDVRILNKLTEDARMPFIKLAKNLKVSNTLVHQRIKKMYESGILGKPTIRLHAYRLGYETSSYTQVMLEHSSFHREVETALMKIPDIVECVNIAGRYALLVKIYARNNRHLREVIYDKIHTIKGIEGTNTTISFETAFSRNVPLEI